MLYGSVDLSTPTRPSMYLACSLVWLAALAIVSVASTLILAILVFVDTVCTTLILTIYAPMIYTAPCIMFWMRAYPLLGEVGGG